MSTLPLDISVWTKDFVRVDWLNDPDSVTISPRHLAVGAATVTVPLNHPKLPGLGADGARLKIDYLDETLMSGTIRSTAGQGGKFNGTISYTIEDDSRLLWRLLGWPAPASALTSQGVVSDARSGPAETVLKGYLGDNSARLGLPIVIAPDLGRGSTITASVRMTPLTDTLLTLLTTSGIGLKVVQEDDHLLVDVYETTTYPQVLTEDAGIVQDWSWSTQGPSATRTVVGGDGLGTSREFVLVVDTALEAQYGDVIETFTDGSGESDPAKLPALGQQTLTDGRPTAGLSLTLSETENFRYGSTVRVGDTVTVGVGPGITITDVLAEASVTWDRDNGFLASPVIGDRSDDPTRLLVKKLSQLGRAVRRLGTN